MVPWGRERASPEVMQAEFVSTRGFVQKARRVYALLTQSGTAADVKTKRK